MSFGINNCFMFVSLNAMAIKTILKHLLSKFAPLSVDMQKAITIDQALINDVDATDVTYIDNEPAITTNAPSTTNKETERIQLMIDDCETAQELMAIKAQLPDTSLQAYEAKLLQLSLITQTH